MKIILYIIIKKNYTANENDKKKKLEGIENLYIYIYTFLNVFIKVFLICFIRNKVLIIRVFITFHLKNVFLFVQSK